MKSVSKRELGTLKFLRKYIAEQKTSFIWAFIFLCASSSMVMILGWRVQTLIDYGLGSGDSKKLFLQMLIFIAIAIATIVTGFFRYYFVNCGGEKVIQSLRTKLFDHVIGLSIDKVDSLRNADILTRMTSDIQTLQHFVSGSISVAIRNFFMIIGCIVMLFVISPFLSSFFLISVPPVIFIFKIFGRKIKKLSRELQNKLSIMISFTEETIYGMQIVQSFTHEEYNKNSFQAKNKDATDFAINRAFIRAVLLSFVSALIFIAIGCIVFYGGLSVIKGDLTAGQFSSFIFYAMTMGSSFSMLAEVIGNFHSVAGSLSRIIDLFNLQTSIENHPESIKIKDFQQDIVLKNVYFHYPTRPELNVLNDLSLHIKKGEQVAIVGLSGAGKSTIFKLLLRFYDINAGSITIDSLDIKKIDLKSLRSIFSYVSQDSQLFSDTVKNNIIYGNPEATSQDIKEALEISNSQEFIERLPDGLDTYIGEKGVALSGGQKQRLAIARAIIKKPQVILFDEATSSLDAQNERIVQEAFDKFAKNQTSIIIAHRLSTVINADKIVVIAEGQIKEIGTHQELLKKDSNIYKKLIKIQLNNLD